MEVKMIHGKISFLAYNGEKIIRQAEWTNKSPRDHIETIYHPEYVYIFFEGSDKKGLLYKGEKIMLKNEDKEEEHTIHSVDLTAQETPEGKFKLKVRLRESAKAFLVP